MKFSDVSPATFVEILSEFLGTSMLVFTVGCNVLAIPSGEGASWGALSIASVLAIIVYGLGDLSGAHVNPAVSVSLGLSGKCPWPKVFVYAFFQIVGGLCGGTGFLIMFGKGINLEPTDGHMLWQAAISEICYTCMLCFVVLNVAASKMHGGANGYYGLAIGGVVAAGAYSGGSISKGCFNPGVAMGLDVSGGGMLYGMSYVGFELIGAVMAAAFFRVCRPEDFKDTPRENVVYGWGSKLFAEFLGTFLLMLTVGLDVMSGAKAAAVSIAAALTTMIFALGSVSGGHFNPAVTLACFINDRSGALPKELAALYVVVQMMAGVLGAVASVIMENGRTAAVAPVAESTWLQAMLCEFTFTFLLAGIVITVTAKADSPVFQFAPLAIGLTIVCGGLASGHISGGVLNPAVGAGLAVTSAIWKGGMTALAAWMPYAGAELLGGAVAAIFFYFSSGAGSEPEVKATGGSYGSVA